MNRHPIFALTSALIAFAPFLSPAAVFTIDGTTRLDNITVPNTGTTHIRFAGLGYQNPGSLTLSGNGSDTLYFERASQADSAVQVSGVLAHLDNQAGIVIFRNLAIKLNGSGILFDTSKINNHNLTFDSCTVLGDGQNSRKVFAWGGDGASSISIANSMFSATGSLSLTGASSISIANSMFSATGSLSLTGASSISIANSMFSATGSLSLTGASSISIANSMFSATGSLSLTGAAASALRIRCFQRPGRCR